MLAGLASLLAGEEERFCQESENRIIFRSDWDTFALPAYFCKESNQASSSTVPDSSRQESVKTVSESKLGIDFTRACQHDFTIELKSAAQDCSKVTVRQLPDEDEQLGAVVWDCGLVLCRILDRITAQLGPDWLHKTLVVELGSGTGVVGLCAAQLGAKRLVLSDRAEMLELLTSNCNGTLAPNSLAQTSAFSWGESLLPEFERQPDEEIARLVLCSDVLYASESHPQLLRTLDQMLDGATAVLLAVKFRKPAIEIAFLQSLEELGVQVYATPLAWCEEAKRHAGQQTALSVFYLFRP